MCEIGFCKAIAVGAHSIVIQNCGHGLTIEKTHYKAIVVKTTYFPRPHLMYTKENSKQLILGLAS